MGFGIGVHKEISASMTALKCETSLDATQLSALKRVQCPGFFRKARRCRRR